MNRFAKGAAVAVIALTPMACAAPGGSAGSGGSSTSGGGSTLSSVFGTAPEDESKLSPAERRLREDNRIYNETILGGAVQGAVQGALVGLVVGLSSGGSLSDGLAGAAIGAAAGGVVGGIDGWMVANRQEAANKKVREIDLATDKVLAENRKMQQSLDNIDTVIAQTTRDIRTARNGYRRQTVSLDEMRAREARAARNLEQTEELIEKFEDRQAEQERIAEQLRKDGHNTAQIDREIAETRRQIAERERAREILAAELEQQAIAA